MRSYREPQKPHKMHDDTRMGLLLLAVAGVSVGFFAVLMGLGAFGPAF